jgi:hypothetical protein
MSDGRTGGAGNCVLGPGDAGSLWPVAMFCASAAGVVAVRPGAGDSEAGAADVGSGRTGGAAGAICWKRVARTIARGDVGNAGRAGAATIS